jgi:hypothetical protein
MSFGLRLFVKHYLHDARAVTHIEKQQIAEIAAPRYPSEHNGGLARVRYAKRPAIMCAFQIAQKIQQEITPKHRIHSVRFLSRTARLKIFAATSCRISSV